MGEVEKFQVPILFLVYNRPDVTKRVFERIREVQPKQLFVAADGPRANRAGEQEKCQKVRELAVDVDWDCEVKTLFREENLVCRRSVSSAITWFFENVEEGIILEDDCLPNYSFFSFCENLLDRYRDHQSIMMISGDNFQDGKKRGSASYYFSRYTHIWGWATWRRAWHKYEAEVEGLDSFLTSSLFTQVTTSQKERKYWSNIFRKVRSSSIDSWAYIWHYSVWKNDGLSILPNNNLVSNIGFGPEATHTKQKDSALANTSTTNINKIVHPNEVRVDKIADMYTFNKTYQETTSSVSKAALRKLWHLSPHSLYTAIKSKTESNKEHESTPIWHTIKAGSRKGLKIFLDIEQFAGWSEMVEGTFDHFLYESLLSRRSDIKDSVVWDIGAHFGYHSMLFASLVGEKGKVFSFEPNPYNRERFSLHLKENANVSDRIKLLDLALSNVKNRVEFSISSNVDGSQSTGSHLNTVKGPLDKSVYEYFSFETIEVQTDKGDRLVADSKALKPDLIKLDVEGAEALVLEGCVGSHESKPILLIEIHNVTAMHDCLQTLCKYDYKTSIIDRDTASLSRCFILAL